MNILIIILVIGLLAFIIGWFIVCRFHNTKIIKSYFNSLSITVCGKRGSGKDTLFSYISHNTQHNSNIPLHPNTNVITLDQLMIPGLSRKSLVYKSSLDIDFEKYKQFENPTYISR